MVVATGRVTGGTDLVREVRKQFPEEVVTRCWERKSAGRAGVHQGKEVECVQEKKGRHVGRPCGMVVSKNRKKPQLVDQG